MHGRVLSAGQRFEREARVHDGVDSSRLQQVQQGRETSWLKEVR